MTTIIAFFTRKIKRQSSPLPQPAPRSLTLFEQLDLSLAHGYAAVNWSNWSVAQ